MSGTPSKPLAWFLAGGQNAPMVETSDDWTARHGASQTAGRSSPWQSRDQTTEGSDRQDTAPARWLDVLTVDRSRCGTARYQSIQAAGLADVRPPRHRSGRTSGHQDTQGAGHRSGGTWEPSGVGTLERRDTWTFSHRYVLPGRNAGKQGLNAPRGHPQSRGRAGGLPTSTRSQDRELRRNAAPSKDNLARNEVSIKDRPGSLSERRGSMGAGEGSGRPIERDAGKSRCVWIV